MCLLLYLFSLYQIKKTNWFPYYFSYKIFHSILHDERNNGYLYISLIKVMVYGMQTLCYLNFPPTIYDQCNITLFVINITWFIWKQISHCQISLDLNLISNCLWSLSCYSHSIISIRWKEYQNIKHVFKRIIQC